jgi:hypothetical protein
MNRDNVRNLARWVANVEFHHTGITPLWMQTSGSGYACPRFPIAELYAWHVFAMAQSHGLMLRESILEHFKSLEKRPSFPFEMKISA